MMSRPSGVCPTTACARGSGARRPCGRRTPCTARGRRPRRRRTCARRDSSCRSRRPSGRRRASSWDAGSQRASGPRCSGPGRRRPSASTLSAPICARVPTTSTVFVLRSRPSVTSKPASASARRFLPVALTRYASRSPPAAIAGVAMHATAAAARPQAPHLLCSSSLPGTIRQPRGTPRTPGDWRLPVARRSRFLSWSLHREGTPWRATARS